MLFIQECSLLVYLFLLLNVCYVSSLWFLILFRVRLCAGCNSKPPGRLGVVLVRSRPPMRSVSAHRLVYSNSLYLWFRYTEGILNLGYTLAWRLRILLRSLPSRGTDLTPTLEVTSVWTNHGVCIGTLLVLSFLGACSRSSLTIQGLHNSSTNIKIIIKS